MSKYMQFYKPCDRMTVQRAIDEWGEKWDVKDITVRTSGADLTGEMYNANIDILKNRIVTMVEYNILLKWLYVSTETRPRRYRYESKA